MLEPAPAATRRLSIRRPSRWLAALVAVGLAVGAGDALAAQTQPQPQTLTQPSSAAAFVERLLRGDDDGARAMAVATPDLAEQTLRLATLTPPRERVGTLTALAAAVRSQPVGLRALRAAATAMLEAQHRVAWLPDGYAELVPRRTVDDADEESSVRAKSAPQCTALLARLRSLVQEHRAAGTPGAELDPIDAWLDLAAIGVLDDMPQRIRVGASLRLPEPTAEPVLARLFSFPIGNSVEQFRSVDGAPAVTAVLPAGVASATLHAPPGSWLLELRGATSRALGRLVVSDLDLASVVVGHDAVVVATHVGPDGVAAAAGVALRATLGRAGAPAIVVDATTDADGVASFAIPDGVTNFTVEGATSRGPAWCTTRVSSDDVEPYTGLVGHVFVDRPVYRAGEFVQGRVLIRSMRSDADGRIAASTPPALRLRIRLHGRPEWRSEVRDDAVVDVTTDAHGVATFTAHLPDAADPGIRRLTVYVHGQREPVVVAHPFVVESFRRSPLLVDLALTDRTPSSTNVDGLVTANYANGAAAADVPVTLRIADDARTTTEVVRTNADGRAPFVVRRVEGPVMPELSVTAVVAGADGQELRVERSVATKAPADRWQPLGHGLEATSPPRVGTPWTFRVRGRPDLGSALSIVGHRGILHALPLRADSDGWCTFRLTPDDRWWPRVSLVRPVAGEWMPGSRSTFVTAERESLHVTGEGPTRARPGDEVTWTWTCRDDQRRGVVADLAVAIVDERVFRSHADRTEAPVRSLAPAVHPVSSDVACSEIPLDAAQLDVPFARLMDHGIVPGPYFGIGAEPFRRPPGAGGSMAGDSWPSPDSRPLRQDFRATAHFAGRMRTDANGRASLTFRLPDTVTRYRLTAVAVRADDVTSAIRTDTCTVSLPLATDLVLPRLLRTGDAVDATAVVAIEDPTDFPSNAEPIVEVVGNDSVVAHAASPRRSSKGVWITPVRLTAHTPGETRLIAATSHPSGADRAAFEQSVVSDAIQTTLRTAALVGRSHLDLDRAPVGDAVPVRQYLSISATPTAVAADLAARLRAYPYGCAEQTLSRLAGWLAEHRAARLAHGVPVRSTKPSSIDTAPLLDRLRTMQGRSGASWWPGAPIDREATIVFRNGLAMLREAGIDRAAHGLQTFDRFEIDESGVRRALAANDPSLRLRAIVELDLAIGSIRADPEAWWAPRAVESMLRILDVPVPRGLLARAGRSAIAVGNRAAAQQIANRLRDGVDIRVEGPFPAFGEDAVAATADALELFLDLGDPHAATCTANLLAAIAAANGQMTTHSQAAAALALARLRTTNDDAANATRVVTVEIEGVVHRWVVDLSSTSPQTFTLEAAVVGPIVVDAGSTSRLLVERVAEFVESGATAAATANGLVVSRRVARDTDGDLRCGDRLAMTLQVTSATDQRYVMLRCPMPAGFEPVESSAPYQRDDAELTFGIERLTAQSPLSIRVELVAGFSGLVAWPPVAAFAMYEERIHGRTGGEVLAIGSTPAAPATQDVVVLTPRPKEEAVPESPDPEIDEREIERLLGSTHAIVVLDPEDRADRLSEIAEWIANAVEPDPDDHGDEDVTSPDVVAQRRGWLAARARTLVDHFAPHGRTTSDPTLATCAVALARYLPPPQARAVLDRLAMDPRDTWYSLAHLDVLLDGLPERDTIDFVRRLVAAFAHRDGEGTPYTVGQLHLRRRGLVADLLLDAVLDATSDRARVAYDLLPASQREHVPLSRRLALATGDEFRRLVMRAIHGTSADRLAAWTAIEDRATGDVHDDDEIPRHLVHALLAAASDAEIAALHVRTRTGQGFADLFGLACTRGLRELPHAPEDSLADLTEILFAAHGGDTRARRLLREMLQADCDAERHRRRAEWRTWRYRFAGPPDHEANDATNDVPDIALATPAFPIRIGTNGDVQPFLRKLASADRRRLLVAAPDVWTVEELVELIAMASRDDVADLVPTFAAQALDARSAAIRTALSDHDTDALRLLCAMDLTTLRDLVDPAVAFAATLTRSSYWGPPPDGLDEHVALCRAYLDAELEDVLREALVRCEGPQTNAIARTLLRLTGRPVPFRDGVAAPRNAADVAHAAAARARHSGITALSPTERAILTRLARLRGLEIGD